MDQFAPFEVEFSFRDGISAAVCGFCRQDQLQKLKAQLLSLSDVDFGPLTEGILIDHRFARLLSQAAMPVQQSVTLIAGCVRLSAGDGPCGAILGNLDANPESAQEGCTAITLPDGKSMRLLLRPGFGAVAFFCRTQQEENDLYCRISAEFPAKSALEQLERDAAGFLWAVDYLPGDPLLDGSCQAYLISG